MSKDRSAEDLFADAWEEMVLKGQKKNEEKPDKNTERSVNRGTNNKITESFYRDMKLPLRPGLPSWKDICKMESSKAHETLMNLQREQKGLPPIKLDNYTKKVIEEYIPISEQRMMDKISNDQKNDTDDKNSLSQEGKKALLNAVIKECFPSLQGSRFEKETYKDKFNAALEKAGKDIQRAKEFLDDAEKNSMNISKKAEAMSMRSGCLRVAYSVYSEALAIPVKNPLLIGKCYMLRCRTSFQLENYGRCLKDVKEAIAFLSDLSQAESGEILADACLCGAKAYLELGNIKEANNLVVLGISKTTSPKKLQFLGGTKKNIEGKIETIQKKEQEAIDLAKAVIERGIRLKAPNNQFSCGYKPLLDYDHKKLTKVLRWPVHLLYPLEKQSDIVLDWDERVTIDEQFQTSFGALSPPLTWDKNSEYRHGNLAAFILLEGSPANKKSTRKSDIFIDVSKLAKRYLDGWDNEELSPLPTLNNPTFRKVNNSDALGEVLCYQNSSVDWIPTLFVVPKNRAQDFMK